VHRVFPSNCKIIASSQLIQFRKNNIGDSGAVVTPFMQDGTYPSRNFATLGPSGLRPPFTGIYKNSNTILFYLAALGRCQILYIILWNL